MVKSSLLVLVVVTLASTLVSAGVTDEGCYGNELNNNASKAREDCIQQLIRKTGVNLNASSDNCRCSAKGIHGDEAAKALYQSVKGNMNRDKNRETCFVNVGDCFNEHNIRTCGVATVNCTNK